MSTKAIILDFDDVILESMDVKTKAFTQLFADYPQHMDEILRYHLNNVGIDRFEKFRYIYKQILKQPLSEERFQQLCDDMRRLVLERVIASTFVAGAKEFLERYYRVYDLYVVSATPQEEMEAVVRGRRLSTYFKGVFGSPAKKDEHVRRIITEHGYDPKAVVSIGDGLAEYEAARAVGCDFIARVKPGEPNRFAGLPGIRAIVPDLTGIETYL